MSNKKYPSPYKESDCKPGRTGRRKEKSIKLPTHKETVNLRKKKYFHKGECKVDKCSRLITTDSTFCYFHSITPYTKRKWRGCS